MSAFGWNCEHRTCGDRGSVENYNKNLFYVL